MTPKKNTVHSVTVDEINDLGYGVCRVDGAVCFIKDGVAGDRGDVRIIKSASSYCVGKWESLIAPSGLRRDPICAAYPACGGCAFGRIDYAEEAKIKTDFVRRTFDRAGLSDVEIVPLDPAGYRAGYPACPRPPDPRYLEQPGAGRPVCRCAGESAPPGRTACPGGGAEAEEGVRAL